MRRPPPKGGKPKVQGKPASVSAPARGTQDEKQAADREGSSLFNKHPWMRAWRAAESADRQPLATTRDGVTTVAASLPPALGERVEAHEAVHRAQHDARGVPLGDRDALEADAHRGAAETLAGHAYTPQVAAPPGLALHYDGPPELEEPNASYPEPNASYAEPSASYPEEIPQPDLTCHGPPDPEGPTFMIDGVELANNVAYCRWQLDRMQEGDLDAPARFVENVGVVLEQESERLAAEPQIRSDHERWGSDVSGGVPLSDEQVAEQTTDVERRRAVLPFLKEALEDQQRASRILLHDFDTMSVNTTVQILELSRAQVERERAHYGVGARTVEVEEIQDVGDHGWRKKKRKVTEHSMSGGTASQDLAAAASILAEKRREIASLEAQRDASVVWKEDKSRERTGYPTFPDPAFQDRSADLHRARAQYAALIGYFQREFPLLGSYAMSTDSGYYLPAFRGSDERQGTAGLAQIAAGPNAQAAQVVGSRIGEVIGNIDRSLEALRDGDLKPWKLPEIVAATKLRLGVVPGTPQDKLIDREIEERVEDEALWAGLLAAFTLALGLIAAIPTGGLSLEASIVVTSAAVGTAALSAYALYQGMEEYEVQSAARDTAFNRANAISQAEPSLFWVAIAIVGFGLDLGPALRAFRAVAPAARGLQAARTADDAVRELDLLRRLGNEARPGLGDDLAATALREPHGAQLDTSTLSAVEPPAVKPLAAEPPTPQRRPTWQESERDVSRELDHTDFTDQKSFFEGKEVTRGTTGSTRPDNYSKMYKLSVDVKNYEVTTSAGRSRLIKNVTEQVKERAKHLPPGTRQGAVLDFRGQQLSPEQVQKIVSKIINGSDGLIHPDDIVVKQ